MKRKLLVLAVLLGVWALGATPAPAAFTCSPAACAGGGPCVCPPHTPAAGLTMDCETWRADCYYL
jgi:hypothetical protein